MKALLGMLLLLAPSVGIRAEEPANARAPIEEIMSKGLLSVNGKSPVFPAFKFFDGGKLVGFLSGAPTPRNPLQTAVNTVPAGLETETLKGELATIHLAGPIGGKTLLVYRMNQRFCPPCDDIIAKVKGQMTEVGWANAKMLTVDVTSP